MMQSSPASPAALLAALAFQAECGADEAIGAEPVNRLVPPAAPPTRDPAAAPAPSLPAAPAVSRATAPAEAARPASKIAGACRTLEELRDALRDFSGCGLKATATTLVFADGNPQAPLMLVGEAPGREEDLQGKPFVGASGQLLDRILAAAGFSRATNAYITNVILWRPPGNREPTPEETQICLPFLERHIALVRPRVLLALGNIAARQLLGTSEGITRVRGSWGRYRAEDLDIPVIATFHPANLLRSPLNKRHVWRDMLAVQQRIGELEGSA